jgi:hypothetical protein
VAEPHVLASGCSCRMVIGELCGLRGMGEALQILRTYIVRFVSIFYFWRVYKGARKKGGRPFRVLSAPHMYGEREVASWDWLRNGSLSERKLDL